MTKVGYTHKKIGLPDSNMTEDFSPKALVVVGRL